MRSSLPDQIKAGKHHDFFLKFKLIDFDIEKVVETKYYNKGFRGFFFKKGFDRFLPSIDTI